MPTKALDEKIERAARGRDDAERKFRNLLREAREAGYSWSQLATASGMSMHGVRYLTLNLNERRKGQPPKTNTNNSA